MRFTGKAVVITGGSAGIGRATAIAFGREGANVVIGDIRTAPTTGQEGAFETYYDSQHVDDILAVPGFVSARRYQSLAPEGEWAGTMMSIYEIEAESAEAVMAEMGRRYGTDQMPLSDTVDSSRTFTLMAAEIMPLRESRN